MNYEASMCSHIAIDTLYETDIPFSFVLKFDIHVVMLRCLSYLPSKLQIKVHRILEAYKLHKPVFNY